MKTVPSAGDSVDIHHHALCDESPDAGGPVKGQAAAVGCRGREAQAE